MKKKRIIISISLISILMIFILLFCYFNLLYHYQGKTIIYEWSDTDTFNIENITVLNKDPNNDFIILNLADIQMCDLEDLGHFRKIHQELDELIKEIKPDLITLTGDQTWSNENLISLRTLIRWLDSYKIPYAPVFGNHDYGNKGEVAVASVNYCSDLYEASPYCLYRRGPSNLGALGNYVINILEDGKLYQTLYFMAAGYNDIITDEQIAWFKWNAEGIKDAYGELKDAMCFMHKPLPEFRLAYGDYLNGNIDATGDVVISFSLSGTKQNGFFDVAKEYNVKDIICGHQHGNIFTLNYEDVRLTFALKTGELCSYFEDEDYYLNGATYFVLNDDITINNYFVDKEKYHISDEYNVAK